MPLLISSRVTILCAVIFSPSSVVAIIRQFLFCGVAFENSSRTVTSHRFIISIMSSSRKRFPQKSQEQLFHQQGHMQLKIT
ncbi:MAG: hypothetical protein CM15mP85_30070 [Rhodobacterales bacterium]|nr:MAG: hypothetical protein CM15mP85_30070 [Rhodobacterales bacterium]